MSKTVHFVSGLPRAGSTLLMNLLAQNPKVHATATSGLHEIGYIARQFSETEEFKTIIDPKDGETLFYDYVKIVVIINLVSNQLQPTLPMFHNI